jgi:hypothetical protein
MGTILLIKETPEKSLSLIYSTHCNNKAALCTGSNNADHFRADVLNSLDGKIKISVNPFQHRFLQS